MSDPKVRVRFAPSPTGYLHVGGARTALYNWLFARHHGGVFVLRIEDTDFSRSTEEMVEGILRGMRWLGLDWDEGPVFQSQRIPRYRDFALSLLESGCAYRCFCPPSELAERRAGSDAAQAAAYAYNRRCLQIGRSESAGRAAAGEAHAIRFRVPEGKTVFHDHVFGTIDVDNSQIEDFVLLRSDGIPTYHLGVVVDDLDMEITHVVRGADHISNTPKQVMLYRAAGHPLPEFAHLPLILGPDRQRLSKRHGATSVMSYAEEGYLPAAFFNFLALLGWSPGDDREILSREELIALFALEGVGKANAVFGTEKLDWYNGRYLQAATTEELHSLAAEELATCGIWPQGEPPLTAGELAPAFDLLRSRLRRKRDFSSQWRAFFTDDFAYEADAAARFLRDPKLKELLPALLARYESDPEFTLASVEAHLRRLADEAGVKAGVLINALRVGLTGQGVAPGLFEVMTALGRDRTFGRIRRLAESL